MQKRIKRNNKQGLSQVVTIVIIILLGLVAIGIIWAVVYNLLTKTGGEITTRAGCFPIILTIDSVAKGDFDQNGPGDYFIQVTRQSGGDPISRIALSFIDAGGNSVQIQKEVSLQALESKQVIIPFSESDSAFPRLFE